jgi:two-component system, NarL family, sensor histidine kinase UhpB
VGRLVGEHEHTERRRVEAQLRDFSAYLNESLEEERTRISRQVHDELGGALTGIKMMLRRLQGELPSETPGAAQLAWLAGYTDELLDVVRRIASDLRPAVLDDLGLLPALEWQLQAFEQQSGLVCRLNVQVRPAPVSTEIGTAVFRIIKECLTNILRHAEAKNVTLTVREADGWLTVTVEDDGRGVAPDRLEGAHSLGMLGMRERAHLVGGDVEIESQPGQGTKVRLRVPQGASP